MIREVDIGRNFLGTSAEAAKYLGKALTSFKKIVKEMGLKELKSTSTIAGRYDGRDIRNIQIYLGQLDRGMRSDQAREFVRWIDTVLEGAHEFGRRELNEVTVNPKIEKVRGSDTLIKETVQLFTPSIDQRLSQMVTSTANSIRSVLRVVNAFSEDLVKAGFELSLDTRITLIMYLLRGRRSSATFEIYAHIKNEEKEESKSPSEILDHALKMSEEIKRTRNKSSSKKVNKR